MDTYSRKLHTKFGRKITKYGFSPISKCHKNIVKKVVKKKSSFIIIILYNTKNLWLNFFEMQVYISNFKIIQLLL